MVQVSWNEGRWCMFILDVREFGQSKISAGSGTAVVSKVQNSVLSVKGKTI